MSFKWIGRMSRGHVRKVGALSACLTVIFGAATGSALLAAAPASAAPTTVVSLTFDNASETQMTAAADMKAVNLPGTFYVPAAWIGLPGFFSMGDLNTLVANGDEIGGKTVNNIDMTAMTQSGTTAGTNEAEREVCQGRNDLIADGFDVTDFAFPFADYLPSDEPIAQECGFNSARGVGSLADAQPKGCAFPDCPYAETIPPTDPYSVRTPDDAEQSTTVAELETDVTNAETNGGGLLAFSFHQICDTSTAGCDPIFSFSPANFNTFVQWLATQVSGGLISVETMQQVIGGTEQPPVTTYPAVAAAPPGTNALVNPTMTNGLTVTASPATSATTTNVTYSVHVSEGTATPAGTVIVSDGDGGSCTVTTLTAGAGSCAILEEASPAPYVATATYSGDAGYPSTSATLTGTVTVDIGNGTTAPAPVSSPTCWSPESFGSNTPAFSWNPTGGINGTGAETINLSNVQGAPNEDANLVTTFDQGACAPTATTGHTYQLSMYYESSTPVFFNLFGRSTTNDTWSYLTGSPTFPAASTWTLATWLSPAIPANVAALSFGMTINENGTLSTSNASLVDEGAGVPPPAPDGTNALANPLLTTSDGSGTNPACWTPAGFGTNSPTFTWSPTGGQTGGEETINMTSWTDGDAKLITTFDNGNCAPTVVPGDAYTASVNYESTVPVFITLYGRSATDGTWSYLTQTPVFPAANAWTPATFTTPPVPAGVNGLSYGMTIAGVGTLSTSNYSLVEQDTPSVYTQPVNQAVTAGQTASFTAAASGLPAPTVQWQVSTDGGTTWNPVAGATSGTLTLPATTISQSQSDYEAVFTNSLGSATSTPAQLLVTGIAQTITFSAPAPGSVGGSATLAATGGASGSPVVFSLDATSGAGVCTLSGTNGSTVNYVAPGTCVIDANQAGNDTYAAAATVKQSVVVGGVAQTITFGPLANRSTSQAPFTVSATASSGLAVTFTTTTPTVCTAGGTNGSTITLLKVQGSCTVVANQGGNTTYAPAPAVSQSFTVTGATAQTITFAKPANATLIQSPLTVSGTANSGLAVTFTTTTPTVCTAGGTNGTTITLLAAGTCTVVANQAGNTTYAPAPAVSRSFNVTAVKNTITFAKPANATLVQSPLTVSGSATSGLAVTFTTTTPTVCTAGGTNGTTITLLAAGTCTVVANQAGGGGYGVATAVSRNFNVTAVKNTITFAKPANATLAQSPLTVSATASSGLAVTFTTTTPTVCTAGGTNGTTITLLKAGTCTIVANQAGGGGVAVATAVSRNVTVTAVKQTITFTKPANAKLAQSPLSVSGTATSGLAVTFTTTTPTVCTAGGTNGTSITLLKAGTCTVVANQPGGGAYAAAPAVSRNFTVS